jgi:hypothetical protein
MPTNPLDLLKANNYNYGDIVDKKAAAEQNQTYFAYWDTVGGTGPEIIDQTSYAIKYLIDTEGNIYNPEPDVSSNRPQAIALYNLLNNFEIGKNVTVKFLTNNPLSDISPDSKILTGTHKVTHIGRFQLVASSETEIGIYDYAPIIFFDIPAPTEDEDIPDLGCIASSYDNGWDPDYLATEPTGQWSLKHIGTSDRNSFHFSTNPGFQNGVIWPSPAPFYDFRDTSSLDTGVSVGLRFKATFKRMFFTTAPTTLDIMIVKAPPGFDNPNSATFNSNLIVGSQTLVFVDNTIYLNSSIDTGLFTFSPNDRLRVWTRVNVGGDYVNILDGYLSNPLFPGETDLPAPNTYSWTIYQSPIPSGADTSGLSYMTSSYWTLYNSGSTNTSDTPYFPIIGGTSLLKSGKSVYDAYANAEDFNLIALVPTSSIASSYQTISTIFKPEIGDYIRFEYDKNKVFKIYDLFVDEDNGGSSSQRLYLRVFPEVPVGTTVDHFVLYRIINDGSSIILDVKRDIPGGVYTGILQPEYVSQELVESYDTIVQNLTEREIIN